MLDYQVPLKARQGDQGVGKIDLPGVTQDGRFTIIELKVPGETGRRSDAPPAALMEALRYAAILKANIDQIASEATELLNLNVSMGPPIVQVLAPAEISERIEADLGISIEFLAQGQSFRAVRAWGRNDSACSRRPAGHRYPERILVVDARA